jgi:hypothetical protein
MAPFTPSINDSRTIGLIQRYDKRRDHMLAHQIAVLLHIADPSNNLVERVPKRFM